MADICYHPCLRYLPHLPDRVDDTVQEPGIRESKNSANPSGAGSASKPISACFSADCLTACSAANSEVSGQASLPPHRRKKRPSVMTWISVKYTGMYCARPMNPDTAAVHGKRRMNMPDGWTKASLMSRTRLTVSPTCTCRYGTGGKSDEGLGDRARQRSLPPFPQAAPQAG